MKQTENPQPVEFFADILKESKKLINQNKILQRNFELERDIKNRLYFFILRSKLVEEYEQFCKEYEQLIRE